MSGYFLTNLPKMVGLAWRNQSSRFSRRKLGAGQLDETPDAAFLPEGKAACFGCSACSPKSAAPAASLVAPPSEESFAPHLRLVTALESPKTPLSALRPEATPKNDFLLLGPLRPSSEEDGFGVVSASECSPEGVRSSAARHRDVPKYPCSHPRGVATHFARRLLSYFKEARLTWSPAVPKDCVFPIQRAVPEGTTRRLLSRRTRGCFVPAGHMPLSEESRRATFVHPSEERFSPALLVTLDQVRKLNVIRRSPPIMSMWLVVRFLMKAPAHQARPSIEASSPSKLRCRPRRVGCSTSQQAGQSCSQAPHRSAGRPSPKCWSPRSPPKWLTGRLAPPSLPSTEVSSWLGRHLHSFHPKVHRASAAR